VTRREDKVIAGVCAGVAYRLGIDPNVVRVVAVVLALFGGVGVLLYALGWLLLPEQRTGRSLAERALRGGEPDPLPTILLSLGLLVVALGVGFGIVGNSGFATTVLIVSVIIGAVLLTRRLGPDAPGPAAAPAPPPPYSASATAPPSGPPPAPAAPPVSDSPAPATAAVPRSPYRSGPPAAVLPTAPAPAPPRPRRPRSMLGWLTFFAAVLAVGLLGVIDALGASISLAGYLAAALAVVGTGLVVGTWYGRSRGLIALGAVLVAALVPVATVEQLGLAQAASDRFEAVDIRPTTVAEVAGRVDEYGFGDVQYDLTEVDLAGETVGLEVRMGAGELVVDVPADATLVVDIEVGAGEIDVLGRQSDGLAVSSDRTVSGEDGAGTVQLDVRMGFGTVEVNRAQS
jgi:phage shock protein PspC (stress-responsive transcriptional regulator)